MKDPLKFTLGHFPCWMIADPVLPGACYGFPALSAEQFDPPAGFKLACHFPGNTADPDRVDRGMGREDVDDLLNALERYFPGSFESVIDHKVCLYTNTPDEHFILDHLQGYGDTVVLASCCSGHGFKFTPAIGEIIADLVTTGKTNQPVGFLSASRFARKAGR